MQNARLDEGQTGIKISGRNINNLRYADDFTLSEEKLKRKSLQYCKVINLQLIKKKKERKKESERGEWKNWLNTKHSKMKIMASGPTT